MKKYILVLMAAFFVVIMASSVAAVVDPTGATFTDSFPSWANGPSGMKIVVNNASGIVLKNVTQHSGGTGTHAYISTDGESTGHVANASYSSNVATFNLFLSPGTYYVLSGASTWSGSFTLTCAATGPDNYPIVGTNINYTAYYDGNGDFTNRDACSIVSVGSDYYAEAVDPFLNINVNDLFDNSDIEGLIVTLADGTTNTTDASGNAYFDNKTAQNFNVTDPTTGYFNLLGQTASENLTTNVNVYGAFPTIYATNVEGFPLDAFNVTSAGSYNETTGGALNLLLPPNTTTDVNITGPGYLILETNVTTTGQDSSSYNKTGLYQNVITINATNAYTGAPLSDFSGWAYHNETGYNYTFNDSGTGTATLNAMTGNYTIYVDVDNYSISSDNTRYNEVTGNAHTETFSLYSENSIYFNFYDEDDNTVILSNVTTIVSGNTYEETFYTTDGFLFVENLTDGNYTAKISAANYTQKTYDFTVADRSSQVLNAYLSSATSTVTFTLIDDNTFQTIEGASVSQQRLINSTWTTVGSKTSDITGRAQFIFSIGTKYRFTITKAGYDTRVFELDPIIFTSYSIQLTPTQAIEEEFGLFDVTLYHYPKVFTEGEQNNLSVVIDSPGGSLTTYGAVVTSPNGTQSLSGVNAYGDQLDFTFFLNNTQYLDRVNVTIYYQSVYGENKSYNYAYVIDGTYGNGTLMAPAQHDYGLGTIEKALLSTGATVVGAGLVGLFLGPLFGLITGLFLLGYFVLIDFLSLWFVLPALFVGILIIMGRSNE